MSKRAKVLFIGSNYLGCNYVRCALPSLYGGYKYNSSYITGQPISPEEVMSKIDTYDVVVFHRPEMVNHHELARLLQKSGKKIVYDNDDTAHLDETHPFYKYDVDGTENDIQKYITLMDNFARNVDACSTTTEFLANEYRKLNKNVVVLPNCVDPEDWPEPLRNESNKVRIGIVGSTAYTTDLNHVRDVIERLDAREDVQLVLFGLWGSEKRKENPLVDKVYNKEYELWDSLKNVEHVEWCNHAEYHKKLNDLKLDMMIIPRSDTYFNRCKSNVKFLEAGMLEIPCIAQGFPTNDSPYDNDINGENGILIKDNTKWEEEINRLVKDKELRREMGRKAKQYVLNNYHIENNVWKWQDFYDILITK